MTRAAASLRGDHYALGGIIAVSLVLRIGSALYQGDAMEPLPGVHDQVSYHALAQRVLSGSGFSFATDWWPATPAGEPTAHWSYLYTLYLAGVYGLFGVSPLAARLIQAVVVGLLGPWLACRIGSRLFGRQVGLVAAGLTAVYVYFVYYAGSLVTEPFYILSILWIFDLVLGIAGVRMALSPSTEAGTRDASVGISRWVLLGLAIGAAILLRQLFLIFVPVLFAWLLWSARSRRKAQSAVSGHAQRSLLAGLLVSTTVLLAMILPWTVRNYEAFGRFVLLNTNAGYAFYWGNHPIHGTDFVSVFPSRVYGDLIPDELRHLDEAALDQALLGRGLRFVIEDPGRYAQLSLSRVADYFTFWPSASSGEASNLARVLSFGLLLPFALYGFWIAVFSPHEQVVEQRGALVLLGLFLVAYSLVHLLSWALIRYRLPVDAVLILFAALSAQRLALLVSLSLLKSVRRRANALPRWGGPPSMIEAARPVSHDGKRRLSSRRSGTQEEVRSAHGS